MGDTSQARLVCSRMLVKRVKIHAKPKRGIVKVVSDGSSVRRLLLELDTMSYSMKRPTAFLGHQWGERDSGAMPS